MTSESSLSGICGGCLGSILAVVQLSAVSVHGILVTALYASVGAATGFITQAILKKLFRKLKWNF
jgi:hypothetical protein